MIGNIVGGVWLALAVGFTGWFTFMFISQTRFIWAQIKRGR